jgi:hypothetical protein
MRKPSRDRIRDRCRLAQERECRLSTEGTSDCSWQTSSSRRGLLRDLGGPNKRTRAKAHCDDGEATEVSEVRLGRECAD